MHKISLGIVSQTPLIKMLAGASDEEVTLSSLKPEDYMYTVGGVAQLINSELAELVEDRIIRNAVWFSLGQDAPKSIVLNKKLKIINISLESESSRSYTYFKENVWRNIHNLGLKEFTKSEYLGYFRYNSKLARAILQYPENVDLFELHDFQQVLLGAMIGPSAPSILRWHIPIIPELLNKKIKKFIVHGMEGNEAVIVSTKRDLEGLIRAGYKGMAWHLYPNLDPKLWARPSRAAYSGISAKYGITNDDFVVLNVARMDSMKSQDDLIKAVSLLKSDRLKLMLVGDGSFTSSKGGLGHPKGRIWKRRLLRLTKRLGLEGRVIFTGYLTHGELEAAYKRADLFVLPSRMEGFGLTAVEAWLYNTPTIISRGAGISELIMEGLNGFTFSPGDFRELAILMHKLYSDNKLTEKMGGNTRSMARVCYTSTTTPQLEVIYEQVLKDFVSDR